MSHELIAMIDCALCGRLYKTQLLSHEPTDEEKAKFQRGADEDHYKLHELNEIQSKFEKLD